MNAKIREKIKKASIQLENYGINDLAWAKEDAIDLINSILNDEIGVLGGDVYQIGPESIKPLYDNWHCEKENSESQHEYLLRSKLEALHYIKNYPVEDGEQIVFVIVFSDSIYE